MTSEPGFEESISTGEYKHVYESFKKWAKDSKGENPATQPPAKFNDLVTEYLTKSKKIFTELTGHNPRSYWAYYAAKMSLGPQREVGGVKSATVVQQQPAFPTFKAWLNKYYAARVKHWQQRLKGDESEPAKRVIERTRFVKKTMERLYDQQLDWVRVMAHRSMPQKTVEEIEQEQSELKPRDFNKRMRAYNKTVSNDLKHLAFLHVKFNEAMHEVEKAKHDAERRGRRVHEMVSPDMRAKHRELAPYKARRDEATRELRGLAHRGKIEADEVKRLDMKTLVMWEGLMSDLKLDYLVDLDKLSDFKKAVESLEAKANRLKKVE